MLHTIVFDKTKYTPHEALSWCRRHDYKADKIDLTKHTIRVRQLAPITGANYFTKKITEGISMVFMVDT